MGCRIYIFVINRVDIFCRLSTMHEHDRQTDRQTNNGTVASITIDEIACQRCRPIIILIAHKATMVGCSMFSIDVGLVLCHFNKLQLMRSQCLLMVFSFHSIKHFRPNGAARACLNSQPSTITITCNRSDDAFWTLSKIASKVTYCSCYHNKKPSCR